MSFVKRFKESEEGVTALEYALIIGMVSLFLITALSALAPKIARVFEILGDAMNIS